MKKIFCLLIVMSILTPSLTAFAGLEAKAHCEFLLKKPEEVEKEVLTVITDYRAKQTTKRLQKFLAGLYDGTIVKRVQKLCGHLNGCRPDQLKDIANEVITEITGSKKRLFVGIGLFAVAGGVFILTPHINDNLPKSIKGLGNLVSAVLVGTGVVLMKDIKTKLDYIVDSRANLSGSLLDPTQAENDYQLSRAAGAVSSHYTSAGRAGGDRVDDYLSKHVTPKLTEIRQILRDMPAGPARDQEIVLLLTELAMNSRVLKNDMYPENRTIEAIKTAMYLGFSIRFSEAELKQWREALLSSLRQHDVEKLVTTDYYNNMLDVWFLPPQKPNLEPEKELSDEAKKAFDLINLPDLKKKAATSS